MLLFKASDLSLADITTYSLLLSFVLHLYMFHKTFAYSFFGTLIRTLGLLLVSYMATSLIIGGIAALLNFA
jgi:hypothetical protein